MKKDITSLNNGIDTIIQLNPVKFKYNADNENDPQRVGFIAQEVQEIIPEIVNTVVTQDFPDGVLGITSTDIIPYLVKAIKELKQEFDEYKQSHP